MDVVTPEVALKKLASIQVHTSSIDTELSEDNDRILVRALDTYSHSNQASPPIVSLTFALPFLSYLKVAETLVKKLENVVYTNYSTFEKKKTEVVYLIINETISNLMKKTLIRQKL